MFIFNIVFNIPPRQLIWFEFKGNLNWAWHCFDSSWPRYMITMHSTISKEKQVWVEPHWSDKTSGRVQLSKSRSLLSSKVVVLSFRLTCLKASMFIEVSSSMFEVVASPLIGPGGLGVWWVLTVFRSSTTWIVATVWWVWRLLNLSPLPPFL